MKKRLLKPPQGQGEIVFLPALADFLAQIKTDSIVGTAHQPYFFHPGISIKFLLLTNLPAAAKGVIFLDSDRINLSVNIPGLNRPEIISLFESNSILDDYPTPLREQLTLFLQAIELNLKKSRLADLEQILANYSRFKDIFCHNSKRRLLKDVLAETFLQFHDLQIDYRFLSDLVKAEEFREFFLMIYRQNEKFAKIFNLALEEYKQEFRFRYKNYPFPRLEEGELPFWLVREGKQVRCFKADLDSKGQGSTEIFPRAVSLTIFLRLYKFNFFIHGIGGANYEWVQDRIIERFFGQSPPGYAVASGTFLLDGFPQRDFPYFLFSPQKIRETVHNFIAQNCQSQMQKDGLAL